MGHEVTIRLTDEAVKHFTVEADRNGRTVEDELSRIIERYAPKPRKDTAYLLALSDRLRAATPGMTSDSTPYIRWTRDTNAGRLPGSPPFDEGDAGR